MPKEEENRGKALQMREAALRGMSKKRRNFYSDISSSSDDDNESTSTSNTTKEPKKKRRASKGSVVDMLSEKYKRKSEIKEQELELSRMELEFQKEKFAAEAQEKIYNSTGIRRK